MSRYNVRDDDRFEVTVGWDDPLGTYFAHVLDKPASAEEDVFALEAGMGPAEITDDRELVRLVRPFAELPDGLLARLRSDQANRQAPTAFQRDVFSKLTGQELP